MKKILQERIDIQKRTIPCVVLESSGFIFLQVRYARIYFISVLYLIEQYACQYSPINCKPTIFFPEKYSSSIFQLNNCILSLQILITIITSEYKQLPIKRTESNECQINKKTFCETDNKVLCTGNKVKYKALV